MLEKYIDAPKVFTAAAGARTHSQQKYTTLCTISI